MSASGVIIFRRNVSMARGNSICSRDYPRHGFRFVEPILKQKNERERERERKKSTVSGE